MERQELNHEIYEQVRQFRIDGNNSKALEIILDIFRENLLIRNKYNFTNFKIKENVNRKLVIKMLEEFSIICYYTDCRPYGINIIDKLLFDFEASGIINKNLTANNQKYYMEVLPRVSRHRIQIKCEPEYIEMNPSIIKVKGGYLLNCRTGNFGLKHGGIYYVKTSDGIVNTKNYFLRLDTDLNIIQNNEIIDDSEYQVYNNRPIKGLEDIIIFEWNNEIWFTCTTLDTNPHNVAQISLCKLPELSEDGKYLITVKRPIKLVNNSRSEKNWLPFVDNHQLIFVYSYHPLSIRVPMENEEDIIKNKGDLDTELFLDSPQTLNFGRFRGSAGPLKFENKNQTGYLFVVHEVSWNDDNSRVYTHRFVYVDINFNKVLKISNPFYFEHHGVEFCRSMCYSHSDYQIVLTVGIKDEQAWLYMVSIFTINKMLKDIDNFSF